MTRLQRFLLPTFLLVAATLCHAGTTVSGAIATTTWTSAGSPYTLSGNVSVPAGEILTIGPGVQVTNGQLIVNGSLRAQGTEDHPIEFVGTRLVADGALEFDLRHTTVHDVIREGPGGATSLYGGAMLVRRCTARLTRCRIRDNEMTSATFPTPETTPTGVYGGGLAVLDGGTLLMDSCHVIGNRALAKQLAGSIFLSGVGHGAAIYLERARAFIANTEITDNECNGTGAAVCSADSSCLEMTNCLVARNTAYLYAYWSSLWPPPGQLNYSLPVGDYTNCTIVGNGAEMNSGTSTAVAGGTLRNCIVWENLSASQLPAQGCEVSYSDISGGTVWPGTGNISADPVFADSAGGDLSLVLGSPCIDAGDPEYVTDSDGSRADMGVSNLGEIPGGSLVVQNEALVSPASPAAVQLFNTGNVPITVASIAFTGPFSSSLALPVEIAGRGGLSIPVTFTGTASTTGTMTLSFAGGSPADVVVGLTGAMGTAVSGAILTGTWTSAGSPYVVTGPLEVLAGETLTIEAGVAVVFDADVPFTVSGAVHVHGSEESPVSFGRGATSWQGIRISGGDSSSLCHTSITGGLHPTAGGGVYVGGEGTRLAMNRCEIAQNTALFEYYGAHSSPHRSGNGGGICADGGAKAWLADCLIRDNVAPQGGSGVCAMDSADLTMTRCVVWRNDNTSALAPSGIGHTPGAVSVKGGARASIVGCTIARNYRSGVVTLKTNCGVDVFDGTATIVNTVLWQTGYLAVATVADVSVHHCLVDSVWSGHNSCELWDGSLVERQSAPDDPLFGQGSIGGDPSFTNPDAGDFSLLPDSPCVDAGDPTLTDPDGSRSDIGASSYDGPVSVATGRALAFDLRQNLPNPFNPVTTIPYAIAEAGPVTLSVYNLQGQLVRTLVQEIAQPGEHHAVWDGRDFTGRAAASGVYLCRLVAPEGVRTMRMTLVR